MNGMVRCLVLVQPPFFFPFPFSLWALPFFPKFMFVFSKFFLKGKKKNFLGRLRITVLLDFISLAFCVLFFFFFVFWKKIGLRVSLCPTVPTTYRACTVQY